MAKRRRRRRRRSILPVVLVLLILIVGATAGGVLLYYDNNLKPVQSESEKVIVTIDEGDTISKVIKKLDEAGLVRNAQIAYYYARLEKINTLLAGTFELDKSWDVGELLTYMSDSANAIIDTVDVTLIEGDWAKDMAKKIAASTSVSYEELVTLWNDEAWIREQMDDYEFLTEDMFGENVRLYLEGYLFPETYTFYQETTPEDITLKIFDQTEKIYEKFRDQIEASDYTTHEIFTIASIVQYEAGGTSDEDMKTVAGIIYNRLDIYMPLQCSVTVCYAIDFDKETDDWTACEVNGDFESPYNTYLYTGLTPGPIENPGEQAFEATLNPISSDYYFWMADIYGGTGIHYAKTYAEHLANCNKYGV